jgi:phage-related protein
MVNQEQHSAIQSISQRINKHCSDIKKIADAIVEAQYNNPESSLNQRFDSAKSSMLKTVIVNMVKTYGSIRNDVKRIANVKGVAFDEMFPKLDVNFETYYTIAISMLNLIYQLQYMKIYCQTI